MTILKITPDEISDVLLEGNREPDILRDRPSEPPDADSRQKGPPMSSDSVFAGEDAINLGGLSIGKGYECSCCGGGERPALMEETDDYDDHNP
jgi:hypothetical protein